MTILYGILKAIALMPWIILMLIIAKFSEYLYAWHIAIDNFMDRELKRLEPVLEDIKRRTGAK